MTNEIIKRIENGPAVLFIGQKYLSMDYGIDFFLTKTLDKFKNQGQDLPSNYNSIIKLGLQKDTEMALAWMNNLSKSISTPEWLERIATIPWASVFTTAFDSIFERAFINEWRTIQPINDESFKAFDPRNKFNLHISYLMGNIDETELSKIPPFSSSEKIKRKSTYFSMLNKIPEIVTPRGILIIDGYDFDDQLSVDDIFPTISKLNKYQTVICSCSDKLRDNELIAELVDNEKVILFDESFAYLLVQWELDQKIKIDISSPDEFYGKWLTIHDNKVRIPQAIISRVSKVATIIDDKIFHNNQIVDEDSKYLEYRKFLASTNGAPLWSGFPLQFAFKRDTYEVLFKFVTTKLRSNIQDENPIILFGQSSSGKTTALGQLACDIRQELKLPILFIEKRYQKVDEKLIDEFCIWAEDNGAKSTVIIWDGMLDADSYYNLLRKLNTRGRKVILIGSGYATDKITENNANYIQLPIQLTAIEKIRFAEYLKGVDPILTNIIPKISEANFLAMLYRFLPLTRTRIKSGLKEEFDFFSKVLGNQKFTKKNQETHFQEFLKDLKIAEADVTEQQSVSISEFDKDAINLAERLIFLVMVPGKYGLKVPFEILLSIIGFDNFSNSLFEAMNKVDIISWHEGHEGDLTLGPRTALEAKILTDYLGNKATEIEYIKLLLKNIKSDTIATAAGESDYQIQFAVELLGKVGPNSQENFYSHLYDLATELWKLRESGQAVHPRLILKEASFLREIVKKGIADLPETSFQLLERAEDIVRDELYELDRFQSGRNITTYLRVELAAILGTQAIEYAKNNDNESARETYEMISETINYAFSSSRENYNALDVLGWATIRLIEGGVFNQSEQLAAESQLLSFIEVFEIEGLNDQHLEEFNNLKLKFYDIVGKQKLAENTFELLKESGYTSGFYIRAKNIVGFTPNSYSSFSSEEVERYKSAFTYLNDNFDFIKNDGKCLYLLLKCWWVSKTKEGFFANERATLPFAEDDWDYCLRIINLLLNDDVIYQSATTYYIKGIAEFHLGLLSDSSETFRLLESETNFSLNGRRRIAKSYLASDQKGNAIEYSGSVKRQVAIAKGQKVGDINVDQIKAMIPFLLHDFHKEFFQQGERISRFYIGFNFRGPIAVPFKNS